MSPADNNQPQTRAQNNGRRTPGTGGIREGIIREVDQALRTLTGVRGSMAPGPVADRDDTSLTDSDRELSGRLMRINHCGEVCAQALYRGQALSSKSTATRAIMEKAAEEETAHLNWCESRLAELDTRTSRLNPAFYALSFAGGVASGLLGDRFNLGFVAATEEQVVTHLDEHLEKLPDADTRSREILSTMKEQEDEHRTSALRHGGADFPRPVKKLMTGLSKVMTRTTYWV